MVITPLVRKSRQVLTDPILRRWILMRLLGREKKPSAFTSGRPPYLSAGDIESPARVGTAAPDDFPDATFDPPGNPIRISLPGETVELFPEHPAALFTRDYADLETELAAHRFAWVPISGRHADRDWVAALWKCWADLFGDQRSGWAWHAYTAAERAINIIDFSCRFGLPDGAERMFGSLANHADAIRTGLEYYGDHNTSNHLSNNGRGLLRIGAATGDTALAEVGANIMVSEAGRIFGRSGVLREGSTHYHLLLTRNYLDAWCTAADAALPQAGTLRSIAERALAVIPGLQLQGGMPLFGDISPDVPPGFLSALTGREDETSWPANLPEARAGRIMELVRNAGQVSPEELARDGWHRFGEHGWQTLTYQTPDGWPPMPGHGHKDLGSFELHHQKTPVVIDPGRGSYADFAYENAEFHNGILINGQPPVPENRPYYSDAFRRSVVPVPPDVKRVRGGHILTYRPYTGENRVETVSRQWIFSDDSVELLDRISGTGKHTIRRQFIVPGKAAISPEGPIADIAGSAYRFETGVAASTLECTKWEAYGCGEEATRIAFDEVVALPYEGKTVIGKL